MDIFVISIILSIIFGLILFNVTNIDNLPDYAKIIFIILGGPIVWLFIFLRFLDIKMQ